MYLATFDGQGNRITSYVVGIHTDIPANAVQISDEDQAKYATNDYMRGADGKPVKRPAYVPTLTEEKIKKWDTIKSERDRLEQSGVPYLGKIIDSDMTSIQRIAIAVQAAQVAIAANVEFSLDWTCSDDTVLTMTASQVVAMSVALAQFSNDLHQIARGLREKIESATTKEELDLIVWPE